MNAGFREWLDDHEQVTAAAMLGAAFLVRLWLAHGTFLNPDEALHFQVANHASWASSYQASLTTAHPPLLIFVLHFWRDLGTSEWMLRLPSVIAGTAFCWFLFRWLGLVFTRTIAWLGLLFCCFLPPLIALSSEVRQYGLLLCFLGAALYLAERALAEKSPAEMFFAYTCVWLGVLTHYSALLFAAALGAYLFLRLMEDHFPGRLKIVWGASQLVLLALFDFLYRTHLERLNAGEAITSQPWLANSIFHSERQDVFLFVLGRSFGVFQFVFGQLAVGDVAGLLFLLGIFVLIRAPYRLRPAVARTAAEGFTRNPENAPVPGKGHKRISLWMALLLILPFVLNCGAALVGAYPYGGTRHSGFLIPFALAGVSIGLALLVKQNRARAMMLAVAVVMVSAAFGKPHRPYMTRADQSSRNMSRAIASIKQQVPENGAILVDYQTSLLLDRYLCAQEMASYDRSVAGFLIFRCGRFRVLSTGPEIPIFTAQTFLHEQSWQTLENHLSVNSGDKILVVQAGWDIDLASQLRNSAPQFHDLKVESFGRNIEVFGLTHGPEGLAASP